MPFKQKRIRDVVIVTIKCLTTVSINSANFKDYLIKLHENTNGKIIIDLREVLHIDSSFIGALVIYFKNSEVRAKITCGNNHGEIWEMFKTTKIYKEMGCFSDLDTAINEINTEFEKVA